MKFINLRTTCHDEKLKDRMKNNYFKSNNKGEKNVTYFQDMLDNYKKVLTQLESHDYKNMLKNYAVKSLASPFSLTLYYGYLGDNAPNQKFSFSDIVFNFEMVISCRFEKDGYMWYSDGKYAFSVEMARETMVRIVGLLIKDLEREIRFMKERIEFVDGSSANSHMSHDGDTEPTGLQHWKAVSFILPDSYAEIVQQPVK